MNNLYVVIVSDIDDGGLIVNGVFDNEASAKECLEDDFLAASALIYKLKLNEVQSRYIPFEDDVESD